MIYYFPTIKYLGQIFGVIFIDAGVAWNDKIPNFSSKKSWQLDNNEGWIMSFGFGPRFNFLGMPWKLDYAWQYNPHRGIISSRKWYLSIGIDFSMEKKYIYIQMVRAEVILVQVDGVHY